MSKTGTRPQGRTRWRRFAAAAIPALAAATGLVMAQGTGALAASFYISGLPATITADKMVGTNFGQYGWVDASAPGSSLGPYFPIAVTGIKDATIYNLCQSVVVPLGTPVSLVIKAGQDPNHPVTAHNLIIDMDKMSGDASFKGIDIGIAANQIKKGADGLVNPQVPPNMYGQQADSLTIEKLVQRAYATSAGEFNLNGMTLEIKWGTYTCPQ